MKRNPIETVLGAVVLVAAAMFLVFAYSIADLKAVTGYEVKATFLKVGGLERGSDVRISGIDIGTVTAQTLNPETFQAQVTMSIKPDIVLPTDTEATIVSDGLLGGKYIGLSPGGSDTFLKNGSHIDQTQSAIVLESLINKLFASFTNKSGGGDQSGSSGGDEAKKPGEDAKKEEPRK